MKDFSARVYKPAYSNWDILVHTGNTDGWNRVARILVNPGDTILAEEWTYPSALASVIPLQAKIQSVAMDGQGMRPGALRDVLANWDESKGKR